MTSHRPRPVPSHTDTRARGRLVGLKPDRSPGSDGSTGPGIQELYPCRRNQTPTPLTMRRERAVPCKSCKSHTRARRHAVICIGLRTPPRPLIGLIAMEETKRHWSVVTSAGCTPVGHDGIRPVSWGPAGESGALRSGGPRMTSTPSHSAKSRALIYVSWGASR